MATVFRVKLFSQGAGASSRDQWSNTYHLLSDNDIDSAAIADDVTALVNWQKNGMLATTRIDRAVISTFTEGDTADPASLKVIAIGQAGGRTIPDGDEPLPLQVAVKVKVGGATGRAGTMSMRGCLLKSDVEGSLADGFTLIPTTIYPASEFTALVTALGTDKLVVPTYSDANGLPSRDVTSMAATGVGFRQRRNAGKKKLPDKYSDWVDFLTDALEVAADIAVKYQAGKVALTLAERVALRALGTNISTRLLELPGED